MSGPTRILEQGLRNGIRYSLNIPINHSQVTAQQRYYAASKLFKGAQFARVPTSKLGRAAQQDQEPHPSIEPAPESTSVSVPTNAPAFKVQGQPTSEAKETQTAASGAEISLVPVNPAVYTPVVLPEAPRDVLQQGDPNYQGVTRLLGQSALIITREIEMMNIFLGYEQANRYNILSPTGEHVGYLAEEETGMLGGALQRQLLKTHRPFKATVMNAQGRLVLMIRGPLTWINSKASAYAVRSDYPIGYGPPQDSVLKLIGEVQQRWHIYRRRYELFLRRPLESPQEECYFDQFAKIDAGFLSWSFLMQDADEKLVGTIDRNFRGFGREFFTDTGQYVVRFDSVGQEAITEERIHEETRSRSSEQADSGLAMVQSHGTRTLTLDERAVALATAVSIDFDFFSRHSSSGGSGGMFPWFYMGGGGGEPAPDSTGSPYPPTTEGEGPPPTADQGEAPQETPWWGQQQQPQEGEPWGSNQPDPWGGANEAQQVQGLFEGD